jgi:WD40 repeat protein/serine/threonine protein kinase
MSNLVGQILGPYQVLLRVQSTPTNTLYKAYHQVLGRNVALQVILPGQRMPQSLPQRLKSQAVLLARLKHPSIGAVLDCAMYEGILVMVYDFVPRRILARRFGQKMEWRQVARELVPIAQALAYAHAQGMIHGFIRPTSIVIQESGAPVVFDFGVEQAIAEEVQGQTTGTWLGSQVSSYFAPEQVLGKTIDTRADIYSLGMVLYELLTGHRIYEGETPLDEVLQQYHRPIKSFKKRLKQLPGTPQIILEKMLAPDPAKRFQDMQPVAFLLAKYALNQPVHPKMVRDPNWRPPKPITPLAWAGIGLAVLFLLFTLAAGSFTWLLLNPQLANRLGLSLPIAPQQLAALVQSPTPTRTAAPATHTPAPTGTLIPSPTQTLVKGDTPEPSPTPTATPSFRSTPQTFQSLPLLFGTPIPSISGPITTSNVQRLVTLTRLGIGTLNEIAWAPDNRQMALATTTGVYVIDTQTKSMVTYLDTTGAVHSVAYSPDGSRIVTGEKGGLVRVWDVKTGKEFRSLSGHLQTVNRVAFSPDGQQVASVSDDKTARLWNISTGELVQTITQHVQGVTGLAFSPDGKLLATASLDFHIRLWNAADGSPVKDLISRAGIYNVAFFPDGKTLLTGGADLEVVAWDVSSGQKIKTLANTNATITEMKLSSDGRFFAAADDSGQVKVWNSKGEELWSGKNYRLPHLMGTNYAYTHHIAFSPDSTRLASGIWDDTVQIWKAETGENDSLIDQFSDYVNNMEIAPNGGYLAAQTIATNGELKVWDLPNAKLLYTYPGELTQGRVFSYGTNDSRYLAVKTGANDIKIFDLQNGKETYDFGGHRDLRSIAFSDDGNFLISGSSNEVHLWSLSSGQEIILDRDVGGGCTIVKSEAGVPLARATRFQLISFENTRITALCKVIRVGWMTSLYIQKDGSLAAAGGASKLGVWDITIGDSSMKDMEGLFGYRVEQVTISPDGKMVAGAVDDLSIRVWNIETGKEIVKLMGHEASIKGLIFSPDGKYLISSSMDGTVRIWGVQ